MTSQRKIAVFDVYVSFLQIALVLRIAYRLGTSFGFEKMIATTEELYGGPLKQAGISPTAFVMGCKCFKLHGEISADDGAGYYCAQ